MKKVISVILTLALISCLSLTAFAADITTTGGSAGTTISTTTTPSYTVTIPASISVTYGSTAAVSLDITASNFLLEPGKKVTVSAKGSGTGDTFTMANGTASPLGFQLSKSDTAWSAVAVNGEVASFTTNNNANSIYAKVPSWTGAMAGTYSGTITFTIAYVDS